jgi:hypothetical protein
MDILLPEIRWLRKLKTLLQEVTLSKDERLCLVKSLLSTPTRKLKFSVLKLQKLISMPLQFHKKLQTKI